MPSRDGSAAGAEQTQDVSSMMSQVVSMFEALQTKLDETRKELRAVTKVVERLASNVENSKQEQQRNVQVAGQEQQGAAAQLTSSMKLQEAVKKLNEKHDWTSVKEVIEAKLGDDNAAYRQLKLIGNKNLMFYVAYNNHLNLLRLLITAGLDVNMHVPTCGTHYVGGHAHFTLLHVAAQVGAVRVAKLLVDHRADINKGDCEGYTPLMVAAISDRAGMVKWLIEHAADVNCVNDVGYTALHFAAERGREDVVRYLVEAGADTSAVTSEGCTPLELAFYEPIYCYLSTLPH